MAYCSHSLPSIHCKKLMKFQDFLGIFHSWFGKHLLQIWRISIVKLSRKIFSLRTCSTSITIFQNSSLGGGFIQPTIRNRTLGQEKFDFWHRAGSPEQPVNFCISVASIATLLYEMVDRRKGGGRAPPPSAAWADFSIMLECTPESGRCHSVYSVRMNMRVGRRRYIAAISADGEGGTQIRRQQKTAIYSIFLNRVIQFLTTTMLPFPCPILGDSLAPDIPFFHSA